MMDPIAFQAKTYEDTMDFHQAMKQMDAIEFKKAIVKEIHDHCNRKYWEIIKRDKVPSTCKILPSVWSMKHKRDLITRQPIINEARLNIHGGNQKYGVNFYDTFSPVITLTTLRILFILSSINSWNTYQIKYILALICTWKFQKGWK